MKLEKLTLANFRGFDQIEVDFEKDVTVIAGVNGVGKTGVLKALATLMSHSLPTFCACNEKALSLAPTDLQLGKSALTMSCKLDLGDASLSASVIRSAPVESREADILRAIRDKLRASRRHTSKGSKAAQDIDDQIRQTELQLAEPADLPTVTLLPSGDIDANFYRTKSKASKNQPIAVLYSTSRLLSRLGPRLAPVSDIYLSSAYGNALTQSEVSLRDFASWFRAVQEGAIQNPSLATTLLEQVQSTMSSLLPECSELQLHTDGLPRFSAKKDGKRLFLWQFSDGEQGLLALALDLLRRLATANPFDVSPVATGSALVLIDEIELHLHPKWQRHVVRRLRETFKSCQFVLTTHSPQVIGQVEATSLRLLTPEQGKVSIVPITQSFGMDSSWVLQNIMGVPVRDYQTEQRLSAIYQAIDRDDFGVARQLAEHLREEIGDFPDLQEAVALLDRFALLRPQ